jgi:hydrogenase large subunit
MTTATNGRLVVDPVTRIEGHLRIEAQMNGDVIEQAYSSGTMVRGLEIIMRGRDPRDAWAYVQRICGVCTLVHGIASVRAVEDALSIDVPYNAQQIRNLMIAAQYVHDHVMHFYHLHALDWVDVVSALKADTKATSDLAQSISPYGRSSPGLFRDVQGRVRTLVESGQLGIFSNAYWGHPAYKLPPEANLMAVSHYLDALQWQREVAQIHAIFGGKNPHPNFLVGGVPSPIDLNSDSALNMKRLAQVGDLIAHMRKFVDEVYVPDTVAIAGFYKDWGAVGEGLGNFMTFGDFPTAQMNDLDKLMLPRGAILNRDLSTIHEVDLRAEKEVEEYVSRSWYDYSGGKDVGLHPWKGETTLNYTGPEPPYQYLDVEKSYSWLKSPRWKGNAMEVGPLARCLMLYAKGHEPTKALIDSVLAKLEVPVTALYSTLGRTAARTLETKIIADMLPDMFNGLLANIKKGDTSTFNRTSWEPARWPAQAKGVGYMEAPRGGLSHYVVIDNGKISNYQAVVPSTWNAGPRDPKGQPGAYEAALHGQRLEVPNQPLEILRTIHSFDPCLACAVHVTDPEKGELVQVKVT